MTYTRCTSLKQVQEVLDNYEGRVYRDCLGDGYWIDVNGQEHHSWTRLGIITLANYLFKTCGMKKA